MVVYRHLKKKRNKLVYNFEIVGFLVMLLLKTRKESMFLSPSIISIIKIFLYMLLQDSNQFNKL